jgi:hypothetical protein
LLMSDQVTETSGKLISFCLITSLILVKIRLTFPIPALYFCT